jgi:glycosyltransferase involved in cell wall biosynthesis
MTPHLETPTSRESSPSIETSLRALESLADDLRACEQSGRDPGELSRRTVEDAARRCLDLIRVPASLKLSVVMPVYNERNTLDEVLRRVEAVPIAKEIILIDDASSDGTRELVRAREGRPGYVVVYHDRNRGKGAAVRAGFARATGDIVLVQDADLEYDPQDYFRLIEPILDGRADVVFGSRYLTGGARRAPSYWHTLGNRALTGLSNMLTNLSLTDMETCYKVFRREALESIAPSLTQNRFGIEVELTAKVARKKHRVYEVPIRYAGRAYSEGKKISWRDAVAAVFWMVRFSRWD